VPARPIGGAATAPAAQPALYEAVGRIEKIDAGGVTLDHGPVPALH